MIESGVGARILVVEDTAYSMQLMTYLLNAHQHTVIEAVTGEQAIKLASATAPDLVVMDLQLPGIDGFETLTALRSIPGRDPVVVVAVTSFAMVGDRDRALRAGFDHHMTKPIDPETFVAEIDNRLPDRLRGRARPALLAEAASSARPQSESANHRRLDVLVLDDCRVNQTLLRSILEPHGYHVRTTFTVDEAINAVEAACPDLVLSDVHVGQHSGVELLVHLRAEPTLTQVPFAFLSATTDWQDPSVGDDRSPLICRPIEPALLLEKITALLDKGSGR